MLSTYFYDTRAWLLLDEWRLRVGGGGSFHQSITEGFGPVRDTALERVVLRKSKYSLMERLPEAGRPFALV